MVKPVIMQQGAISDESDARLIAAAPELLSLLKRWRALDAGAWHGQRHQQENDDLKCETDDLIYRLKRRPTDD